MRFVDTNVLLYAVSTEAAERAKAAVANQVLSERDIALSIQVLQEFYVQATRQTRADRLHHGHAVKLVDSFTRFKVQVVTMAVMRSALDAADRFQISYWDAAILEAARAAGCEVVLSEDLSHGQDYAGVRVENPFL